MNLKKRYVVAFVVAALASAVCVLLSVLTQPKQYAWSMPEDVESIFEDLNFSVNDASFAENGEFTVTGADPQLIFSTDTPIRTICLKLVQPAEHTMQAQLFYAKVDAAFSELCSMWSTISEGQDTFYFTTDSASYSHFRLDINEDCQLQDILISTYEAAKNSDSVFGVVNGWQALICFVILEGEAMIIAVNWDKICYWIKIKRNNYRENRRKVLVETGLFFLFGLIGIICWSGFCLVGIIKWSGYTGLFFGASGCAVGALVGLWYRRGEKPERTFLLIVLCIGLIYALLSPEATVVMLDDETHYVKALQYSYCGQTYMTKADQMLANQQVTAQFGTDNARQVSAVLDQLYDNGVVEVTYSAPMRFTHLAYLPMAAGMWLARSVGASFTVIFYAGRITNLLCYAIVLYFVVKRLGKGGLIAEIFALFPMVLFSASNYSYDPFCVSFLALGTAIFIDEYRHTERALSWTTVAKMMLALVLGCSAKPIYFPVFLMGLFMPKKKFASDAHRKRYHVIVVFCAAFVLLSFVVPMLMGSGSFTTDSRGGSDVNGTDQIAFILDAPLKYAKVLLLFLFKTYFAPSLLITYAVNYQAYLPATEFGWAFVILLAVAFFYKNGQNALTIRRLSPVVKVSSIISFFCSVCLAATAMYVAFSPVGADTIYGCQERYMMPVLLVMLLQLQTQSGWETADGEQADMFGTVMLSLAVLMLLYGLLAFAKGYV